jgi:hypothetical protein
LGTRLALLKIGLGFLSALVFAVVIVIEGQPGHARCRAVSR